MFLYTLSHLLKYLLLIWNFYTSVFSFCGILCPVFPSTLIDFHPKYPFAMLRANFHDSAHWGNFLEKNAETLHYVGIVQPSSSQRSLTLTPGTNI